MIRNYISIFTDKKKEPSHNLILILINFCSNQVAAFSARPRHKLRSRCSDSAAPKQRQPLRRPHSPHLALVALSQPPHQPLPYSVRPRSPRRSRLSSRSDRQAPASEVSAPRRPHRNSSSRARSGNKLPRPHRVVAFSARSLNRSVDLAPRARPPRADSPDSAATQLNSSRQLSRVYSADLGVLRSNSSSSSNLKLQLARRSVA